MATLGKRGNINKFKSYYLENYFNGNYVDIYYKNYFYQYDIPFCSLKSKYALSQPIKINYNDLNIDDVVKTHTIDIHKIYYNENENKPENDLFEIPNCAFMYTEHYYKTDAHAYYGFKYDNNICIFDSNNVNKQYIIFERLLDKLYEDKKLYYINNKQKIPEYVKKFNVICYPPSNPVDFFISKINFIDHNYHCNILGLIMFDIFRSYYMDENNSKYKTKENIINFMKNTLEYVKQYFLKFDVNSFDDYIRMLFIKMNMFEYNEDFDINAWSIKRDKTLILSGKIINDWHKGYNKLIINFKENLQSNEIKKTLEYYTKKQNNNTKYIWPEEIKRMTLTMSYREIKNKIEYGERNYIKFHEYRLALDDEYSDQIYINNINNIESIKFEDTSTSKKYEYYEKQLLFKPNFYKFKFNIDNSLIKLNYYDCIKSNIMCDNLDLIPKIKYTKCNSKYFDFFIEKSNQYIKNHYFKLAYNENFQNLNIYYTFIDLLNDECKILIYIGRNIEKEYYENYLKIEKYYKECITYFMNYVKTLILNTAQVEYLNPYYKDLKINKNNNKKFIENIEKYHYNSASEIYKNINNSKNIIDIMKEYIHIQKISNTDNKKYYKEYKNTLKEYNEAKEYFKSIKLVNDLDILYYKHVVTNIIKKNEIKSNEDKYKIFLSNYDIIKVTNCDIVNINDIDDNIRMYLNKY